MPENGSDDAYRRFRIPRRRAEPARAVTPNATQPRTNSQNRPLMIRPRMPMNTQSASRTRTTLATDDMTASYPYNRSPSRRVPGPLFVWSPGRVLAQRDVKEAGMTSQFPPAAVPGPDDVPAVNRDDDRQPDPFGEPTDEEGGPDGDDNEELRPKDD